MARNVPLSLPWVKRGSPEAEKVATEIRDLVLEGRLSAGPKVDEAEALFSRAQDALYTVMVSNGTDAIRLALKAAGVSFGDRVIVPGFTFIATANAALDLGAEVVAIDVEEQAYGMDPEELELVLREYEGRQYVLPVHLYGHPAPMTDILEIADRNNAIVIEDSAQGHGARHRGRAVGAIGIAGTFSFYATKNIGAAGEGGAVTTDNEEIANYVRFHKGQGMGPQRYDYRMLGGNERMSEIAAVSIIPQIRALGEDVATRNLNANALNEALEGVPGIQLPSVREGDVHAWHQYTIRVDSEGVDTSRESLSRALTDAGIGNAVYYPQPLDEIRPLIDSERFSARRLDQARKASRQVLSLPIGPWVTEEDISHIANVVRKSMR